ncbi:hypothetical protein QLX67_08935 [Balneolaceae bacterium ANBcel3]|nr:hypothetical protein [Balneolaceae bacterium ANBcel3]
MHDRNPSVNYFREALLHPLNIGFLLTVSVLALMFSGSQWAMAVIVSTGLGLELLYMGTVPGSSWFRKYIQRNIYQDDIPPDNDKKMFNELSMDQQRRFLGLCKVRDRLKENFYRLPESTRPLTQHLMHRVNHLLSDYLKHLVIQQRYEDYIYHATPGSIEIEIKALKKEMEGIRSSRLLEVKNRRLEILEKRLQKQKHSEERALICISQQQTIEDAVDYAYEKSITMAHPDELGTHLDQLMTELDETADIIKDIEDELPPTYTILKNMEHRTGLKTTEDVS